MSLTDGWGKGNPFFPGKGCLRLQPSPFELCWVAPLHAANVIAALCQAAPATARSSWPANIALMPQAGYFV